jgi:hypothetical protein
MFDVDLGGEWYVHECHDDRFKFTREPGTIESYFIIERECNNEADCSVAEIQADLKECKWYLDTDLVDGNGPLMFTEDGVKLNGIAIGGWNLSLIEGHIYLNLDLSGDYMNISKEWKLVECDDHRLQFISENHTLVLEQECSSDNCTEEVLDSYLMEFECYWVAVSVDGSNAYDDFAIQFNDNQDLLIEGGGNNYFGAWSTSGNPNDGVYLEISQLENNFSLLNGNWLVVECGAERIVLVDGDHEMVIERECP